MTMTTLPMRRNRPRASFASLPRELRDEIWSYLLVTQNCVSYTTSRGIEAFDNNNIKHNLKIFYDSNEDVAQDAREFFYLSNTIRLDILDLPGLLRSTSHPTRIHLRLSRNDRPFNAADWVKRLIIRIGLSNSDYSRLDSATKYFTTQLQRLLDCPQLQTVVLDVEGADSPFQLSSCKDSLKALKAKLGKGLRIYHDMGYSYGNPPTSSSWRKDISGMFDAGASGPPTSVEDAP